MAKINGGLSGMDADVNTDAELLIALTKVIEKAGYSVAAGEAHDGSSGVARVVRPIDVSHDYRTRIGSDCCVFSDNPGLGANVPIPSKYRTNSTVMACASGGSGLVINSGNSIAGTHYVRTSTHVVYSVLPAASLYVDVPFGVSAIPSSGQVGRVGWLKQSASSSADADAGAYFELTAGGTWQGCLMLGTGGAADSVVLTGFVPVPNKYHLGLIVVSQYSVDFYIDGVLYGSIDRPDGSPDMTALGGLPLTAYWSNTTGVGSASQLKIGKWGITYGDLQSEIGYGLRMAMSANGAFSAHGVNGSSIIGITNSAAPASATLSNTAAGYTVVDGPFQWAAVAGAETDYDLFAYQVPDSSPTQVGKNLLVSGARVSLRNTGAANSATVPTTVEFYYACGSTGVSLATADSATAGTRAPRRLYLGQISIPVNAVVGQPGDREISVQFPEMITEPGNFSQIIARVVSGAATASQIIRGQVSLDKTWTD